MDLALQISVGLGVLASLVIAYFSFKTWKLYQVLLVVGIFLAGLGYYFLAARVFKTHDAWRRLIARQQRELDAKEVEYRQLQEGVLAEQQVVEEGLRQLKSRLHLVSQDRGEVWRQVQPGRPAPDGTVEATIEKPEPHGLTEGLVLFAFEEKPVIETGQYLGEFRVAAVNPMTKTATLAPSLPMSQRQMQRLATSAGPWSLYLKMPADNQGIFSALDDATKRTLLPAGSVADFAKRDRPLRDYELFFHEAQKDAFLLADAAGRLARYVADANAEVNKTNEAIAYREREQADLQYDLQKFQFEQDGVKQYREKLQQRYDAVHAEVQQLSDENQRLVARLAALQTQLAEEINRRTQDEAARAEAPAPVRP